MKLNSYKRGKKSKSFNATRGWKTMKPQSRSERIWMKSHCGKKCFLGKNLSFPICQRKSCTIKRQGIQSAYIRAKQFKHPTISQRAKKLLSSWKIF